MRLSTEIITLKKRYPFTISRGTRSESKNVLVFLDDGQYQGIGEFDATIIDDKPGILLDDSVDLLQQFSRKHDFDNLPIQSIWKLAQQESLPTHVLAGLDMALWDLLGKRCHKPCHELFGLGRDCVPTSMTIGITPLDLIPERVNQLLSRHPFRYLKIKLGSPDGIDADKLSFLAIKDAAVPYQVRLRVDANGGWKLNDAIAMCQWLASQGVEYVEQPLASTADDQLPELFKNRPLPVFVDESCRLSKDIPALAHCVDGINIKLMKSGGITEALRMVATARAHNLQTMIGCMSESSIAISAAASIGELFDHIDLDSHLNLNPDPAKGAELVNGVVIPNNLPGHGASLC